MGISKKDHVANSITRYRQKLCYVAFVFEEHILIYSNTPVRYKSITLNSWLRLCQG